MTGFADAIDFMNAGAVKIAEYIGPFEHVTLVHMLLELLFGDKMIVDAVHFAFSLGACRQADRNFHLSFVLVDQTLVEGRLSGSGWRRNNEYVFVGHGTSVSADLLVGRWTQTQKILRSYEIILSHPLVTSQLMRTDKGTD